MRSVAAVRYVTPLREGGSLPAIVETDDGGLVVVKLRGAGQGPKALVAEIVAGELAHALGLPVPELTLVELDLALARNEPDPEIRDLLKASVGTNVGLAYLGSATMYDPVAGPPVDPALASGIVVLDSFVMNVDRTARNPNLLMSGGALWLIDHGAALLWHHSWDGGLAGAERPFAMIKDHVLLGRADAIAEAGAALVARVDEGLLARVLGEVPEAWLPQPRGAYVAYLAQRRAAAAAWLEEAQRARARV